MSPRLRPFWNLLTPIATVIALLAIWQLLTVAFAVPTWLLPAPSAVSAEFIKESHLLGRHVLTTGIGAAAGLALGAVCGLALAVLMVKFKVL